MGVFLGWLTRDSPVFGGPIPHFSDDHGLSIIGPVVTDYDLIQLITADSFGLGLICLVFLVGTLLAFLSPVGALLQVIGIVGFSLSYAARNSLITTSVWSEPEGWSLGLGYALGVISTLIVMQSPVKAMLAANRGRPVRMLGRFAALSPRTTSSWR